jgi:pilus assembly protein CpaB
MVTAKMVALQQWPKELAPPGAISSLSDVVDRAVVTSILPGEPLLEGKLASTDSGRGLAALVPSGMRAYTIQTSRVASNVAGFILPGNRVDVLLTLRGNANDSTGGGSSTTLLQAVEVLAVDQRLDAPAENRVDPKQLSSVTLLVTPDQAALLDLGQNMGVMTLSLRNPEDRTEATTRPATLDTLRFTQRGPNVPAAPAWSRSRLARSLTSVAAAAMAAYAQSGPGPDDAGRDRSRSSAESRLVIHTLRGRHAGQVWLTPREP